MAQKTRVQESQRLNGGRFLARDEQGLTSFGVVVTGNPVKAVGGAEDTGRKAVATAMVGWRQGRGRNATATCPYQREASLNEPEQRSLFTDYV